MYISFNYSKKQQTYIILRRKVKNILIFIADSLRWDYTPHELRQVGLNFKCVAASIFTPPSFASLVTGLNVPRHGVMNFVHTIPLGIPTIFELPLNTYYWDDDEITLYKIFHEPLRESLKKAKEPFIYLERACETHVPYSTDFKTVEDYLRARGKNTNIIKEDYKRGVQKVYERFVKRIKILKERGILNRTLIIFTSDHGENLGERGKLLFHNFPVCPELVYVPFILIHPLIPKGEIKNEIIRHVDLLPTIIDILRFDVNWNFEGINILKNNRKICGFNYYRRLWRNLTCVSVWTYDGGYVKLEGSIFDIIKSIIVDIIKYTHDLSPIKYHCRTVVYGSTIENAEEFIKIFKKKATYGFLDNIYEGPKLKKSAKISIIQKTRLIKKKLLYHDK